MKIPLMKINPLFSGLGLLILLKAYLADSLLVWQIEEEQPEGTYVGIIPSIKNNSSSISLTKKIEETLENFTFLRQHNYFTLDPRGNIVRTKIRLDREAICNNANYRHLSFSSKEWISTGIGITLILIKDRIYM